MSLQQSNFNDTSAKSTPGVVCLNLFATDDKDAVSTGPLIQNDFIRPFTRNHRYARTHSVSTIYGTHAPALARQSVRVRTLISDTAAFRNGSYDGTCIANPGGIPTYQDPALFTFQGFTIHPYGLTTYGNSASGNQFAVNANAITGYMACTYTVKFFKPHDNADFYNPI